jgi:hypothetical protein
VIETTIETLKRLERTIAKQGVELAALRAFRDEVRAAKSRYDLYPSSGTGLARQIAAAIARLDGGKGE